MTTTRPILFSAPMVRALLEGRKTQTRRLANGVPEAPGIDEVVHANPRHAAPYLDAYCGGTRTPENPRGMTQWWCWWTRDDRPCEQFKIPYGVPGDLLWVRETWCHTGTGVWSIGDTYMAYDGEVVYRADLERNCVWFPSIHMPRLFSRLTLEITNVRVERLQDISKADAEAEGVEFETADPPFYYVPHIWPHSITGVGVEEPGGRHAVRCYAKLWDHINGPGAWDANPWVVALSFNVHKQNVDAVLSARATKLEPATT